MHKAVNYAARLVKRFRNYFPLTEGSGLYPGCGGLCHAVPSARFKGHAVSALRRSCRWV